MARYRRETRIDAPFADVWAFHSRIDGLEALTPGFVNLQVRRIDTPDDATDLTDTPNDATGQTDTPGDATDATDTPDDATDATGGSTHSGDRGAANGEIPRRDTDSPVLTEGTRITLAAKPLGILPEQSFVSVITHREASDDYGQFVDTMEDGPFPEWRHTHTFRADGDATILRDEVEYTLPGGSLGRAISPLGRIGFEPTFRYRHRRTKRLLETDR